MNRILREVEEGRGTLHALVYDEGRVLKELEGVLARAGTLLAGVERGEGALGVLLRDPDAARAVRRWWRRPTGWPRPWTAPASRTACSAPCSRTGRSPRTSGRRRGASGR